ncbi:MAG TPA: hypothetical protein VMC79_11350 [Rectinemataceae bacterium]|nr:hypothetical protein [Rectinemataceae bacterium]
MNIRRRVLSLVLSVAAVGAAIADSVPSLDDYLDGQFPDNSDLRTRLFSAVIGAPREIAEAYGERVLQSKAGSVTVRVVDGSSYFFVEFLNGNGDSFTQGSCIIKRSNSKGYLVQAKIYLQDDPSCYARLYTGGDGTRLDVIMYGAVVKKGLFIPELLYSVLARPFSNIVEATRRSFDWGTVFGLGTRVESTGFAASLRGSLASMQPAAPSSGAAESTQPSAKTPGGKNDSGKGANKIALAQAPAPGIGRDASAAVARPYRIATLVDRASSTEGLLSDLASSGEKGQELGAGASPPSGFYDDRGDLDVRLPYAAFPGYQPGKGTSLAALRAVLYLDALSSPDSVYAAVGEGLRLTVVPSLDAAGRLRFAFFSNGRELRWNDLGSQRADLPVRILRIQASFG